MNKGICHEYANRNMLWKNHFQNDSRRNGLKTTHIMAQHFSASICSYLTRLIALFTLITTPIQLDQTSKRLSYSDFSSQLVSIPDTDCLTTAVHA